MAKIAKIEIRDVRNCEYQFADNSKIYCEAQFSHLFTVDGDGNKTYNWSNFTADPNDIEKHGRDIFANAENGDYGVVAAYTPPPESEVFSKEMKKLRLGRNTELEMTDNYGLPDRVMTDEIKVYRQELRDITNGLTTSVQVKAVVWPISPFPTEPPN